MIIFHCQSKLDYTPIIKLSTNIRLYIIYVTDHKHLYILRVSLHIFYLLHGILKLF